MNVRFLPLLFFLLFLPLVSACSDDGGHLHDGYYTAEADRYDDEGWKEYLVLYVSNNKIVAVEYDARNSSGFIRSWEVDRMRRDERELGMNFRAAIRLYISTLLNRQDPAAIVPVAGTGESYRVFRKLAEAAVAQSAADDKRVVFVELPQANRFHP